ncbi:hypothetical protein B0T26DRAFT_604678, partial [Lasiosphaeria miniovina]
SYGKVLGATLTLGRTDGTLLIAFVAFFVTVVGSHIWRILCFSLHQASSKATTPQDTLYHQRQTILRNTSDPSQGAFKFLQLVWAWRRSGSSPRVRRRILPIVGGTVLAVCGLAVASGFSAKVALGSEVLMLGANCALVSNTDTTNTTLSETVLSPRGERRHQAAAIYAQQCYNSGSSSSSSNVASTTGYGCDTFVEPRLPFTAATNAPCPF